MAIVKPFKALRPAVQYAKDVAALPYDVYDREEAKAYVKDKPLSFLNIDRPETQFDDNHDMYGDDVYDKANEMLIEEEERGIFVQDEKPYYYLYELTMGDHTQTGIVALSAVDDYLNDVCKKHELTVAKKEADRIHHVDTTSAQTGPIFLTYRSQKSIKEVVKKVKTNTPLYDFISDDGIHHRVWIVSDEQDISMLEEDFNQVPCTYIADGHHRAASAVKVALKRREEHPDYQGNEEFNYFLSVLFPDDELAILDYNRVVKDLNGLTDEAFLRKVGEKFEIKSLPAKAKPKKKGEITMYLDEVWYKLKVKKDVLKAKAASPVDSLDVAILQDELLAPILGIGDPRTDQRIKFVGGIRGIDELVKDVEKTKNAGVAFAMYPTSITELLNVADAHLLMPPKSTWFEPKLRSGLFIHKIER